MDELPLDDTGVLYHVGPEGIERHEIKATKLGFRRARDARSSPAGRPRRTPGWSRPCSAASPARGATSSCSTPRRRCWSPGRVEPDGGGDRQGGASRSTPASAWSCSGKLRAERREADAAKAAGRGRARRARRDGRRRAPGAIDGGRARAGVVARDRRAPRSRRSTRGARRARAATGSRRAVAAAPAPRPVAEALAAARPPPHRRGQAPLAVRRATSPPRTTPWRAPAPTPPAARPRSPSCASPTGSAAPSTTCARSAPPSPCRSWPRSSSSTRGSWTSSGLPGPTSSCCSPCSTRRSALARLVAAGPRPRPGAAGRGARRPRAGRGARDRTRGVIGINNRDLRTLDVDPERAVALRDAIPGDRLAIAESGVRDAATVARWRATGFDAALVGEALMRAGRPGGRGRGVRRGGPGPRRPRRRRPRPERQGLRRDGRGRGARRGPRRRGRHRAQLRARHAARADASKRGSRWPAWPAAAGTRGRPEIVAVTADLPAARLAAGRRGGRPRRGPAERRRAAGRRRRRRRVRSGRRCASRRATDPDARHRGRPARTSPPARPRILLDAAGGPHPGGTGIRVDTALAAAVAREVPITLAGGMSPSTVGDGAAPSPGGRRRRRVRHRGSARPGRAPASRTRCGSRCS